MFEAELGGNPFARFAVARLPEAGGGSGIVAYVCFWIVFEELRLMNLAVDPAWRRRGLATALVRHALREGAKQGTVRATLEVRASNAAARSLYEKLGFRETARRASYYTNPVEDAVLMETPISG
jgi:ribosomal-protein-alanine N-acetyltransferase